MSPAPKTDHRPAPAHVRDEALLQLLQKLRARNYRFITPTPLTHARVLKRAERQSARDLAGVFGWSLPFERGAIDAAILELMQRAGVLEESEGALRSSIRVSTLDDTLFIHSAYPTTASDAVFFGPDTYRFARFIAANLPSTDHLRCVDIGCGSGAGAVAAALRRPASHWLLTDINPAALRFASVNARHAGIAAECLVSDVLAATSGSFDLITANPPYLADAEQRAYRHGGEQLGLALSYRIAAEAVERLAPGGRLLLYTGVAIIDGADPFLAELHGLLNDRDCEWRYEELDPDVFGEELERPAYASADRIAAVGLVVTRRR